MVSKPAKLIANRVRCDTENESNGVCVPGSPNVTAAAIFSAVAAGRSLAALWTSCPPWLYPDRTTLVFGQLESAC